MPDKKTIEQPYAGAVQATPGHQLNKIQFHQTQECFQLQQAQRQELLQMQQQQAQELRQLQQNQMQQISQLTQKQQNEFVEFEETVWQASKTAKESRL